MTQTPKELTETPDLVRRAIPLDLVSDVLSTVRLSGAIFLRAEYTDPWAYESPSPNDLKQILWPQAHRLILFHIIAEGSCWVRASSGEVVHVDAGEVVVLPYGHMHVMSSDESERPITPISAFMPGLPWVEFPVLRYGGGGEQTKVVCGYLHCDDPIFDPVFEALPTVFSVKPPAGPAAAWVAASIQYALDASTRPAKQPTGLALRLPELLFSEVMRLYMESDPSLQTGWLAALRDPIVGSALVELHADPARRWTVEELARRVACSRSALNDRFVRLLGRAPMQYLVDWRLQLAADLLRTTTLNVLAVALQVGYESEEAFNRAFKRALGCPPGQWRQRRIVGE